MIVLSLLWFVGFAHLPRLSSGGSIGMARPHAGGGGLLLQLLLLRSIASLHVGKMATPARHVSRAYQPVVAAHNDGAEGSMVRLDKLLAERGAGSRKDVDKMIRRGLVEIDGVVVGKAAAKLKVPWETTPVCDGFEYPPPPLLVAYHKPLGVVSTMKDDRGRADLSFVLPPAWQKLLHPVGRLDADTTGLLLFSRCGDLTHRLLHPKYIIEREYVATVENPVHEAWLREKLQAGVETVEGGESLVVTANLISVDGQDVRLTVTEGKYRMVRRILANCGHPVVALHRVRYGEVPLPDIEEGDAVPIYGSQLEWAMRLQEQANDCTHQNMGEVVPRPERKRRVPSLSGTPAERDLEQEMAEAAKREWNPPEHLIDIVMEEGGITRSQAVEALRKHEGDIICVLEELT